MNNKDGLFQAIKAFSVLSGLGVYLTVVVGCSIYLGHLFDENFNTHPYGIFAGILLGFPIAIYSLYKRIKKFM